MKKELELKLVELHPQIFRDYGGDMTQTCMHWGLMCGDGWYFLIHNLCKKLDEISSKTGVIIIADQVKEKFGGLRFYYHIENLDVTVIDKFSKWFQEFMCNRRWGIQYNNIISFKNKYIFKSVKEKIRAVVNDAESRSYEICESCGSYGTYRRGNWVRVLCDKCEKKKDKLK